MCNFQYELEEYNIFFKTVQFTMFKTRKTMKKRIYTLIYFTGPHDCTFDVLAEPTCLWTNDASDNFDWKRHSGNTPSSSTGPAGDHTSGSGITFIVDFCDYIFIP